MKKNRIIIPALSLLVGITLAGSISGTIAWYQYSTRAHGAYFGMSGGATGNLQIQLGNGEWLSRLTKNDINSYLAQTGEHYGSLIKPITATGLGKDDAVDFEKMYSNPIAGAGEYEKWQKASTANYISLPLKLRFVQNNGSGPVNVGDKKVYLTELYMAAAENNGEKKDLSDAIRFHISSDDGINQKNFLISKNGGSIATEGKLDLDGDDYIDQTYTLDKYGFKEGSELIDITYGGGSQEAYAAKVDGGILAGSNEDLSLNNTELDGKSKSIGTTLADANNYLQVKITIWIEGWQEMAGSPIWDADYIDSQFDIGFEFATDVE